MFASYFAHFLRQEQTMSITQHRLKEDPSESLRLHSELQFLTLKNDMLGEAKLEPITSQAIIDLMNELESNPNAKLPNIATLSTESLTECIHDSDGVIGFDNLDTTQRSVWDIWASYRSLVHDTEQSKAIPRKMFALLIQYIANVVVTPQTCLDFYTAIVRDMASLVYHPSSLEWRVIMVAFHRSGQLADINAVVANPTKWQRDINGGVQSNFSYYNELLYIYVPQGNDTGTLATIEEGRKLLAVT
jgi:hypothetical protein